MYLGLNGVQKSFIIRIAALSKCLHIKAIAAHRYNVLVRGAIIKECFSELWGPREPTRMRKTGDEDNFGNIMLGAFSSQLTFVLKVQNHGDSNYWCLRTGESSGINIDD